MLIRRIKNESHATEEGHAVFEPSNRNIPGCGIKQHLPLIWTVSCRDCCHGHGAFRYEISSIHLRSAHAGEWSLWFVHDHRSPFRGTTYIFKNYILIPSDQDAEITQKMAAMNFDIPGELQLVLPAIPASEIIEQVEGYLEQFSDRTVHTHVGIGGIRQIVLTPQRHQMFYNDPPLRAQPWP
eukprot:TRINITY_DN105203_c0_g1_i1.p1 TRINITY_DN105203_c0_g1~~TRINITY_DN105203_c0_g1_i1.p1  ORF type:complete len:182 (+),score=23.06 TRINITY_DN105203_c0_g1_i1:192-737(+)